MRLVANVEEVKLMAKLNSTVPENLGHSMAKVTAAATMLMLNGVSPEVAFVLAVAAVLVLR